MIKLKDILLEKSTYFLDKFKGKELSRQQYSEINRELKHLKFGLDDLIKGVKRQNDRVTLDNIQYLVIKIGTLKKVLGLKESLEESPNISGNVKWSNPEAMKFSQEAVNKAAKEIGKAQNRAVSIFTSDLKNNKYDKMDLGKAISTGNIRDASNSKREVLSRLFYDVRERFNKYNRRKK